MNRHQRRALRQHKRASGVAGLTTASLEDVPEKAEQLEVCRLYAETGCKVYSLSQPRATMQTPGLGDLYVFCERKSRAWWHETKAPKGKQRTSQVEFQRMCERCGVDYVLGGFDAAYEHLVEIGVIPKGAA